ncbi:MAG: cobalamin-binding protein [Phycisphaerae bacterium]|nr:MAG: cobalamin-binding protein [Phycisphaerae bacterium]
MAAVALVGTLAFCVAANDSSDPPSAPRRIIATSPSNTEIICALGAADRLVAVSSYATHPPEILKLPRIGGLIDPDMESILVLAPDLLVMRGRNPQVEKLCIDHHIRFYEDKTDTLDTLFTTIRELGAILDRSGKASELIDRTRRQLDDVKSSVGKRKRPKVLMTLRSPDKLGGITTVSRQSYLGQVIELAGGDNIFASLDTPYPQIGLEDIISKQPDIIIEAMPGVKNAEKLAEQLLKQWRDVGNINAAQHGRVVVLTEDYVLVPSPRVVLLAKRLQKIFESVETKRDG